MFQEEWGEERFQTAYQNGFRPKLTKISEEFTFDDFEAKYGDQVLVLFVVDNHGLLHINTADYDLEPTTGQSVIALVKLDEKSA